MVGRDLSSDFKGRREAQRRVQQSRLVFTTCAGAGIGLLRAEKFDTVIVDEASQETEPETLIPLTKGCKRALLVGDHVQLRATVRKHAVTSGFDVSLFERLYISPDRLDVAKVMLDTQYRMHPDICQFSSNAFYDSRLLSADSMGGIELPPSQFPWPKDARKVFVQCGSPEDIGRRSKSNKGQVQACKDICGLLCTPPEGGPTDPRTEIAILTPYTAQRDLLKKALPNHTITSIDGFQGREADIIIFSTVRSNLHCSIGFLNDLRRLNVAITRAKTGLILIGNRATLLGQAADDVDAESKQVWKRLLDDCCEVIIDDQTVAMVEGGAIR
jgi:superfamily I DNA and/or RNA helicase